MSCKHEAFSTSARVMRMEDTGGFMLELEVKCDQCQSSFRFIGVERGLSFAGPMGSVDLTELRIPVTPGADFPTAVGSVLQ